MCWTRESAGADAVLPARQADNEFHALGASSDEQPAAANDTSNAGRHERCWLPPNGLFIAGDDR
jgi:hypothetical protein